MRAVLLMVLVGCIGPGAGNPPDPDAPFGLPDPVVTGRDPDDCHGDGACGAGEVCARNGGCLPPDQVRAVHAIWTLNGGPANRTTCDASPDLMIQFYSDDDRSVSYAPVPCSQGKFTVDRLPLTFVHVRLDKLHHDGTAQTAMIDPDTGDALLDLRF